MCVCEMCERPYQKHHTMLQTFPHFVIAIIFYLMHEYFIVIIYRINIETQSFVSLQQAALTCFHNHILVYVRFVRLRV